MATFKLILNDEDMAAVHFALTHTAEMYDRAARLSSASIMQATAFALEADNVRNIATVVDTVRKGLPYRS